jgi:hypothetical protein
MGELDEGEMGEAEFDQAAARVASLGQAQVVAIGAARKGEEGGGGGRDEVEEVEAFSPLIQGPGETIEEHIFDEGEEPEDATTPVATPARV